ncbi:pectinesterase family protein [Treponema sp.]|uniref:pectinesterase family protein n=1 Tax=Treponema sp. TaxID=166 RepID=UPI00388FF548
MKKIIAVILASTALFAASAKSPKVKLSGTNLKKAKTYKTIQAALDAVGSQKGDFLISLPKGTYEEVLYYKGDANITLSGESKKQYGEDVVIAKANDGDLYLLKNYTDSAQKGRCLFEFEGNGNLTVENITFHNTFERGSIKGSNTQAETIGFDSTGNLAAYNCAFKSHQDTLRMTGKSWFYKCYVEGDTDFIWMESTGKVALFEECEIVSLFDEKHSNHTSYIGAPRMNPGNTVAKGLVVFNSNISSKEGQTTYLARTPWNSGYYNQVAFVANKAKDIDTDLWNGKPLMANGIAQTTIGWKLDKATAESLGVKTEGRKDIISEAEASTEFNGRDSILNRYFDITTLKYKKDSDSYWDVKALASSRNWSVSEDKSKSLLDGETEVVKTTYILDGSQEYPELVCAGFAQEKDKPHYQGTAGSTISFPVKGKSLVTVTGYYAGTGTIQAGKQGAAFYACNTGSTNKFQDTGYIVYEGACNVTITATEKSYITKIVVEGDESLSFNPVKTITVSSEDDAKEVYGRKKLQFKAALNPVKPTNGDYTWSVSDSKAASISATGLLEAANVEKDTAVTVKATSCDANAVSGEFKVKILKPEAGAFAVSWLDSPEASSSLEGTSDNADVAVAAKAVPSKGNGGSWKFNSSKITAEIAKGALSYSGYSSPIEGRDKVYVDFPFTAKENLVLSQVEAAFGNHGTGNMAAQIFAISGGKETELVTDESRKVRTVKKSWEIEHEVKKGETVTIRVVLYGFNGDDIAIPTGKAPTVATITVSGKQK